jgi:hypothetical protein
MIERKMKRARPVTDIRGEQLLRRFDEKGSWTGALAPVLADTAGLPARAELGLDELDWLLKRTVDELAAHQLPRTAIHLEPGERRPREAVDVASFVVAHRAERLFQLVELAGTALDSLEHGSLLPSAIVARSLFELAATTDNVHGTILPIWREASSTQSIREVVETNAAVWDALVTVRLGTRRDAEEQQLPTAVNVLTRLKHFARGDESFGATVDLIYDTLSDVVHPNVGSQEVFWRRGRRDARGKLRMCSSPQHPKPPPSSRLWTLCASQARS